MSSSNKNSNTEYTVFMLTRFAIGVLAAVLIIWGATALFTHFGQPAQKQIAATEPATPKTTDKAASANLHVTKQKHTSPTAAVETQAKPAAELHAAKTDTIQHKPVPKAPAAVEKPDTAGHIAPPPVVRELPSQSEPKDEGHTQEVRTFPAKGMAFVDALIGPLDYELNQRFYGWRPNDLIEFTDNVNNFQLGVLEVTRRAAVKLTERIARTGSTASFDPNLENAMNWLMIKPRKYWFPSAEQKYNDALSELRKYFHRLEKGEANFYSRTDNLIPLLSAFENLLGSCDENLVKMKEKDGSDVSYFQADNYFFYAKGVASAMVPILEAVAIDFADILETRRGVDMLHHAVESCHHVTEINPWLITNSNLGGLFANHRANMAAPISHARFYIGVLIKALST